VTERIAIVKTPPSVLRMSVWAVFAQLSITLLSAGTSIIQNRTLGPDGRGAVGLLQFWPIMLAAFAGAGWVSALGGCISRFPEMQRAYFSAAQLTGLALSAATCCFGWFAIPLLMSEFPTLWDLSRWFMVAIVPLTFLNTTAVAGLEALQRFDLSSHVRIGNLFIQLGLLVSLAVSQRLTPVTYCAVFVIAWAIMTAYGFWLFAKASCGSWYPQWGPLPGFVLAAAPLTWTQVLLLRADQVAIVLFAAADPNAFGAYLAGAALAGMLAPIAQGLAVVLLPESARRAESDAVRLYARMVRCFLFVALLLAIPIALAAPWLLLFLYGPSFESAAYALRISLVTIVLSGVLSMGLNTVQGTGRPGTAALIGAFSALASVCASVALLPYFGYAGAALGPSVGCAIGVSLICMVYKREGATLLSLLPGRADAIALWTLLRRLAIR
jgi:O-antigen/teichoic acid export membrane protein